MTYLEDTYNSDWQSLDATSSASNLIFVDTNLTDYQSLIPDNNNSAVYLINSDQNGIKQISEALKKYSNLESISIFSHGDVGLIELGNTNLSGANLGNYQADIAGWGNALSTEGDLLFYGCNVAANQAGLDFVNQVAQITDADVAASNNLTGSSTLGGDWTLEVATGKIDSQLYSVADYDGILALKFNFTYDNGTTIDQKKAFELAGQIWSDYLQDDATINLHVSMVNNSDLPGTTLGGAVPFFHKGTSFSTFRNALKTDAKSSDDNTAISSLETGSSFKVLKHDWLLGIAPGYFSSVAMTRANAKALGLINPNDSILDGIVVMNNLENTGVSWQYNYLSSSVGSSKIDFTTVAIHEIGHALGFVTLVDGMTQSNYTNNSLYKDNITTFDMFRYENSNRIVATRYSNFSLDGRSALGEFSQGTTDRTSLLSVQGTFDILTGYDVDGFQASHWLNSKNLGIMDPLLELGVRRNIQELDIRAFDNIGWDRKNSSNSLLQLQQQANQIANSKGNINRNVEINEMLSNWHWARRGSTGTLTQVGNIAQFLGQQGFFSLGAFRESFDFSSVDSTEYVTEIKQNNYFYDNSFTFISESFDNQKLTNNLDKNSFKQLLQPEINSTLTNNKIENQAVNDQVNRDFLTQWLAQSKNNQLYLEDLEQILQQPELVKSVVENLDI